NPDTSPPAPGPERGETPAAGKNAHKLDGGGIRSPAIEAGHNNKYSVCSDRRAGLPVASNIICTNIRPGGRCCGCRQTRHDLVISRQERFEAMNFSDASVTVASCIGKCLAD